MFTALTAAKLIGREREITGMVSAFGGICDFLKNGSHGVDALARPSYPIVQGSCWRQVRVFPPRLGNGLCMGLAAPSAAPSARVSRVKGISVQLPGPPICRSASKACSG